MSLPNKPLYQIGDQLIGKDIDKFIYQIESYSKGLLQRHYVYRVVYIPKKPTVELLEKPFSEWEGEDTLDEREIYYELKQRQYRIKRFIKKEEIGKES